MEVQSSLALDAERAKKLTPVLRLLLGYFHVAFRRSRCARSAAIRAALQTKGQPLGAYDVLIAGTGLARGLVVVTSNVGEFSRIGGLQVEDWR